MIAEGPDNGKEKKKGNDHHLHPTASPTICGDVGYHDKTRGRSTHPKGRSTNSVEFPNNVHDK